MALALQRHRVHQTSKLSHLIKDWHRLVSLLACVIVGEGLKLAAGCRVERCESAGAAAWCARWEAPPSDHEDAEPEHLHWPDTMEVPAPHDTRHTPAGIRDPDLEIRARAKHTEIVLLGVESDRESERNYEIRTNNLLVTKRLEGRS